LTAQIVERAALRFTPAGLPALDMSLRHESEVTQLGSARRVSLEIRARAVGAVTEPLLGAELGQLHAVGVCLGQERCGPWIGGQVHI
jgi:primosomal replication protein N